MRKLMWIAVGFAIAAVCCAYFLPVSLYLAAAGISAMALVTSLGFMLRFRWMRIPAMVFFACTVGFLWITGYDALYLSKVRQQDNQVLNATVTAADYSYATDYGAAVDGRIELNGKTYKVLTYLDSKAVLKPGDTVTGDFLLRCTLPGGYHESVINRSNGIFLTARPRGELQYVSYEKIPPKFYPAYLRHHILQQIQMYFPADTAGFARALLLGDTDGIDYETDTAFKLSGIRHVIAVSGLHVTILFSLVFCLTGRRKWITALLGIPVLILFAAVVGFSPSITRACIMHSLMVIGSLIHKDYDPPTALGFAGICMITVNPWVIADVGFQLSMSCMIGILLFSEKIKQYLMDKNRLGKLQGKKLKKFAGGFAASIGVSLGAMVLTTPLCAYYFGVVSLVSPLTNLLTLWIITFIFYGIMLASVVGLLLPLMGSIIGWVISWPIRYVFFVAKVFSSFPLSAVYTESVYIVIWLIFVYLLLTVFLLAKKKLPAYLSGFAAIGLCVALLFSWTEPMRDDFRLSVLDVGQGQCIVFQSEGKVYLVDCGSYSDDHAADEAAAYLLSQGISRVDGVILTHFDADHAGGVSLLLTRIKADTLYLPNCQDKDSTSQALYQYDGGQVVTVEEDFVMTFGNTKITMIPSEKSASGNESGICILFQAGDCDILITGDRNAAGERELIKHMTLPDIEVLIVGHHGSKTSTCRELLIKTKPEIAIISVGADNSYGHPTQEVLDRLTDFGCRIFRTDLDGNVIYRG